MAERANLDANEREFWQRFLAAELSYEKGRILLEEFGSFDDGSVPKLLRHPALSDGERKRAEQARSLTVDDAGLLLADRYPSILANIERVPPALFVEGDPTALFGPTIGIVGTRSASPYGRACAIKFAAFFARAGVTVVSGGAVGIDEAAHFGALEGRGKTVAVLAGGIDIRYPAINHALFDRIVLDGCLVSQFAAGATPARHRFVQRNSLIAMLSRAILVIEAPHKSGALITAIEANEMSKDVFVIPSEINAPNFFGSFSLIRDGATLVYHPGQVLDALGIDAHPVVEPKTSAASPVLDALSTNPLSAEQIVEATGLLPSDVLAELTMLELEGRILRQSGGFTKKL